VPLPEAQEGAPRSATLERTRIDGEGKLELLTTDGETWRSRDAGMQPPKSGQSMGIKPAGLGGYECSVSKWETFLCWRDKTARRG
jgi:hypothetical protein